MSTPAFRQITINYLQNNGTSIALTQREPWEKTMNTLIWLTLATSPIAFLISYHWTYRWAFYDNGGGSKLYWKMLRTDLRCSMPGRHGDIARITRARGWIRKYAKMGNSTTGMHGLKKSFRQILKERSYPEYEDLFMPPKWWIWTKMALCLVWPISLLLWLTMIVTGLFLSLVAHLDYT